MALNKFQCIGNLCADVEVRQVGQSQVGKVNIALTDKFRKQDGTIGEQTEFVTLEIWDKPNIFPYLLKGVQIYAEGNLRTEKWQDQNGQNRYTTKIRVQAVQLLGSKPQSEQSGTAPAPQYNAPAPPPPYQQPAPQRQAPPAPPQYQPAPAPPQPGQSGNTAYPPMNSPAYTGYDPNDLPPEFM